MENFDWKTLRLLVARKRGWCGKSINFTNWKPQMRSSSSRRGRWSKVKETWSICSTCLINSWLFCQRSIAISSEKLFSTTCLMDDFPSLLMLLFVCWVLLLKTKIIFIIFFSAFFWLSIVELCGGCEEWGEAIGREVEEECGNVKFMKMLIRIYSRGTLMEYKFVNDSEL